jgi:hypothetical protein
MVLNRTVTVCVFCKRGRGPARGEYRLPFAFLRWAAKLLKSLKTAMGSYWKKLTWIWVWRHSRLGLAPRRLGFGATPVWAGAAPVGIDGTMPTVNAIRATSVVLLSRRDAEIGQRIGLRMSRAIGAVSERRESTGGFDIFKAAERAKQRAARGCNAT